uniref:Uncharacterized protein n=1 Tax=Moniliophthora roreri TaxID=221103 RepID=A0A0W0F5I2_MONRR
MKPTSGPQLAGLILCGLSLAADPSEVVKRSRQYRSASWEPAEKRFRELVREAVGLLLVWFRRMFDDEEFERITSTPFLTMSIFACSSIAIVRVTKTHFCYDVALASAYNGGGLAILGADNLVIVEVFQLPWFPVNFFDPSS